MRVTKQQIDLHWCGPSDR